jgi:hypothetical protein
VTALVHYSQAGTTAVTAAAAADSSHLVRYTAAHTQVARSKGPIVARVRDTRLRAIARTEEAEARLKQNIVAKKEVQIIIHTCISYCYILYDSTML